MQKKVPNTAGKTQNVFEAYFTPLGFFAFGFENVRLTSWGWRCHSSGSDCRFEPMEYVWPGDIVLRHEYYSGKVVHMRMAP